MIRVIVALAGFTGAFIAVIVLLGPPVVAVVGCG